MSFPLALDVVVAVLLAVTIGYCVVLYRRLNQLRASQGEMSSAVKGFGAATERAQAGLLTLKTTGTELSGVLQERIDEARALNDDLSVLTDSGNRLADRLDDSLREIRTQVDIHAAELKGGEGAGSEALDSESERDLMEALRQAR